MTKHLITDEEFVICQICKKQLEKIDGRHLKYHKIKIDEYRIKYPDSPTVTRKKYLQEKENATKAGNKSKESHNELKTVKCIYCDNEIEIPKNYSNKQACKNCLDKGYENPDKRTSLEAQKRREETFQRKYGVKNPQQIDSVKEDTKNTNEERYGGTGFASEELRQKANITILESYGVENFMQTEEARNLFSEPRDEETKRKISEKLKGIESKLKGKNYDEIHGIEKAEQLKQDKRKKELERFEETRLILFEQLEIELLDSEYVNAHHLHNWKCLKCGNSFKQVWNSIQQGYLCPGCYPRGQGFSKQELEVNEFIKSLGFDTIVKTRKIIHPKEIDIYIPDKNIGIEYNGLYWHTEEMGKYKTYHLDKTISCKENGVKLIHIFEDEWIFKQDIIKERLKYILNKNEDRIKVYARQCVIKEIDASTKNKFFEKYHLQGKDSSRIKLGAFYGNELVSVMTFSHGNISKGSTFNENIWELNRFATNYNYHIPGIASKLLTYFKRNYEWKEIFSYADKRWSNGNLYYELGFNYEHDTEPNYWYIKDFQRFHRFGLRKREDESKDITEYELRSKEGYCRLWDCGSMKFRLLNK
ncbi:MAG: DUF7487 domain-containing protein [bacterium]